MSLEEHMKDPPTWINPCDLSELQLQQTNYSGDATPNSPNATLIDPVLIQARAAFNNAEQFKDSFAMKTFGMDIDQLQEMWRLTYDWLPKEEEVHKTLGKSLDTDYLETLTLDGSLLTTFTFLQKIAVGLEQVHWDQEDNNGPFKKEFEESKRYLKSLLCEIHTAILERGLTMGPDVTRDILSMQDRKKQSQSDRNLRAWLVFRDYMNMLEYVIQVFGHLNGKLNSM